MTIMIEAEKAERLAAVRRLLAARPDEAALTAFADLFFERGSSEDLVAYEAAELAAIAENAWSHLAERDPARPSIRVYDPAAPEGAVRLPTETVVEIVNDDMPFLLDSVMGELTEAGHGIRLVLHPIFAVARDAGGRLDRFSDPRNADKGAGRESLIRIHIERLAGAEVRQALAEAIGRTLTDVRHSVDDWKPMLRRLKRARKQMRDGKPVGSKEDLLETVDFLDWLGDDNFLFLGMRDYLYTEDGGQGRLERIEDSGLGVLTDPDVRVLRRGEDNVNASPFMDLFLKSPRAIVVTKANLRSRVHRRTHLDYVGVKQYDEDGKLVGELRILGLFTSTAYTASARQIPLVRHKIDRILARAGFDPGSHSGKALVMVLETYPRDELFQIEEDQLYDFALRILALDEHPRIRALVRHDLFDRFVSALIYLPRDRYTTDVRMRIGTALEEAFRGRVVSWRPTFLESSLMRVHFIIGRYGGVTPTIDPDALETTVAAIARTWRDDFDDAVERALGAPKATRMLARYGEAFSAAYREARSAERAVADIGIMEAMGDGRSIAIDFYRRDGEAAARVQLALFHAETPVPLSDRVPVLENMGLRVINERTYEIAPAGLPRIYLHDMTLERADGAALDLTPETDARLEALFLAIWRGGAENDGFNALGLAAGLDWRQISILRAIGRYLRQIRIPYSIDYVWAALRRYPRTAAALLALFETRFDPDRADDDRDLAEARLVTEIEAELDKVPSLDDDTILRRYLNLVRSIVRTNAYQHEASGVPRETLAFKIDSRAVTAMPEPKPFREIWVFGPRVEGVHLRFGKVARGGLRWSDRPQDFRTEVLGLVKAQQVKNAVIVPVGAKGGFVPLQLVAGMSRDAWLAEGTEAYKTFVSTLLTVTDNLAGHAVVPPPRVVRHEGDDPYLVVAADKGTATFSDTANGIAEEAGFWLGDAFASGGSVGYDHKKMGITARGAFEAVKRHFREMDVDILSTPFSVAGVGDMSGDVFGNGMLLASTIRLVAAFDHRHIFLDPDPDPASSFTERERLFGLPRSSWADYDAAKISAGGGVYARSEKAIELSEAARAMLGLDHSRATPQEVMNAILRMPVDLLWFGGIGTYIRASTETDADAGDRANDPIRVAAPQVRARVIGEGANLGVTQRARIELGLAGVRVNSDAIDNSAGVNSSDVEVNIKIALGHAVRAGELTMPDRNVLLASMTDEVAHLVLANNYRQTLSLSLAERRGLEDLGYQRRLMETLERAGRLDRAVEFLPDDSALAAREKVGKALTRPELGVLLAYAKLSLKEDLIGSEVPDDPFFRAELSAYFPSAMRERFADAIGAHRLHREIIATRLANLVIDRGGPAFVARIADRTGAAPATVARAAAAAAAAIGTERLDRQIDALDTLVPGAVQLELYAAVQDALIDATVWALRNVSLDTGLSAVVARFAEPVAALAPAFDGIVGTAIRDAVAAQTATWVAAGVPDDLAVRLARLPVFAALPDAILVAERTGAAVEDAARVHFAAAERLRIVALETAARRVAVKDYYDGLALDRARGMLANAHRAIDAHALKTDGGLEAWLVGLGRAPEAALAQIDEIIGTGGLTVSRFAVAAGLIADLANGKA